VNGDFSAPFYKVVSDNRGVNNKLTITHGDLNKIAALGGAAFFEKKKFRWTVFASKGTNAKKAAAARVIELERPGGFATLPGNIYITGTASEGGATLAHGRHLPVCGWQQRHT
jgi:starch-binding outer membrane protein SusE/F